MAKVESLGDNRFCIELSVLHSGHFRGVQRGDTFSCDGSRYEVRSFETFYNGSLKYIVEALPL